MAVELRKIDTEQRNPRTTHIDRVSTLEMLTMMNEENKTVAPALDAVLPALAGAVEKTAQRLERGGRLIYIGAGTSGRIGVLDASECWPTFGVHSVIARIAGGEHAIYNALEGCEDDEEAGREEMRSLKVDDRDVVVGLAASGRTPFVLSALREAKSCGCFILSVSCNPGCIMDREADISLSACVGPEVITGSTRLKSGTAQKMILNMLSTGVMIRLGRVYENLMVCAQVSNYKGMVRLKGILREVTGCTEQEADCYYERTNGNVAEAICLYQTEKQKNL